MPWPATATVKAAAGLRPMAVAFTVAVAGQGMALSSDYVIRVAPGLSATAAGVSADSVANRAMVLSLVTGITALVIGYVLEFRRMRTPSQGWLDEWEAGDIEAQVLEMTEVEDAPTVGHGPALRESGAALAAGGGEWEDGRRPQTARTGVAVAEGPGEGDDQPADPKDERLSLRGRPQGSGDGKPENKAPKWAGTLFAVAVPLAYLALIVYLIYSISSSGTDSGLKGGDAAALVGGIAAITIFLAAFAENRGTFLERSAEHVVDGLVFAFKAMGVVLPIAGFFFIGNGDFAGRILSVAPNADGSPAGPAFLFDLVLHGQEHIPDNGFVTAFGILIIGMVAGLEGSGFSGLPLTGSLAGSLGPVTGVDSETLAAIGQMGNIWSGGGTLVAWSSLIAVAGFARVPVIELARRCFVPVVSGLVLATVVAVVFM